MTVTDAVSRFAANNAELVFCVVVKDVATEFGAIASLVAYLFTVVADFNAGPNTIRGCMTSLSAVVTVARGGHQSRVMKLGNVEGKGSRGESVDINWFITGSLTGFEGGR